MGYLILILSHYTTQRSKRCNLSEIEPMRSILPPRPTPDARVHSSYIVLLRVSLFSLPLMACLAALWPGLIRSMWY